MDVSNRSKWNNILKKKLVLLALTLLALFAYSLNYYYLNKPDKALMNLSYSFIGKLESALKDKEQEKNITLHSLLNDQRIVQFLQRNNLYAVIPETSENTILLIGKLQNWTCLYTFHSERKNKFDASCYSNDHLVSHLKY